MGDDSPSNIIGHGRFKMKLKDGRIRTLLRVLHIPNLARNLISVGKMDVAGVIPHDIIFIFHILKNYYYFYCIMSYKTQRLK